MYTVVVDQGDALFLSLSDQQDIVRADVEVQIPGLMEGLQYIQRALDDPDRMQKQFCAGGTPVLPMRPAQLLIQITPSGISHQTVQRIVIFICVNIGIQVRGDFFQKADMDFVSPQKGHPVQVIDRIRRAFNMDVPVRISPYSSFPVIGKKLPDQDSVRKRRILMVSVMPDIGDDIGPPPDRMVNGTFHAGK